MVHHGGAGTTHAGISAGRPTWVCPFFGDQAFWGHMVWKQGMGPRPCSIKLLNFPTVVAAFELLMQDSVRAKAREMADRMKREPDGAKVAGG